MDLIDLLCIAVVEKENPCHNPSGPGGGQFCGIEGPSGGGKDYEGALKDAVKEYQFQNWDVIPKLKRLALLTKPGGPLEKYHPGARTVYRGGNPDGVSWSKRKEVAQRYSGDASTMQWMGAVHEMKITRDTPAIDVAKITRGWSMRSGNESEVFVVGARGIPKVTTKPKPEPREPKISYKEYLRRQRIAVAQRKRRLREQNEG